MKLKDAAFYGNFEIFANAILKRGKMMSSKFNEDEFFETEISDENYKILEGIILPSKISQKFAQNFETILSLMLRLDPENPTRKLGWRSDEKIHSLSPETFEILLQPLFIQNVSNQVFYEIINLLLTDCLSEDLLDNFIQVLLVKKHLKSLKIFSDISNHKITKIDEDFIEFMLYDISLYYYNLYGLMNSAYKLEFWKWISLKEKKIDKNPAARFFETKAYFENIRENDPRTHVLNEVRRRRCQMMAFVKDAFDDADILIYMVEIGEKGLKEEAFFERINKLNIPILLLINKIDTSDQQVLEEQVAYWKEQVPRAEVYPISALRNFQTKEVFDRIVALLPESPAFFPKDQLTDKPERFFVNEIIREKILLHYKKEVPYSVEVTTESFADSETILHIRAVIMVERESQKGIIIGHKGEALKRVGVAARADLEKFFGKQVHLELFVKVNKDWRSNERQLSRFGYASR